MNKKDFKEKINICGDRAYYFQKQEIDIKLNKLKDDGIDITVDDVLNIIKDIHHLMIGKFVYEMINEDAIHVED